MDTKNYYTPYEYKIRKENYFPKTDADYNDVINLIAGKGQSVIGYINLKADYQTEQYNTPDTDLRLTNGVYASEMTYTDPEWFKITSGGARSIIYDLGGICSVNRLKIRFLKEDASGVRVPQSVSFAGSEDGINFESLANCTVSCPDKASDVAVVDVTLEKPKRAAIIRISFSCSVHIYIDQIEVYGKKNPEGAEPINGKGNTLDFFPDKYCTAADLGGAKDVLLSYFCYDGIKPISVEDYLPFVSYIKDGKITDTLFDGFLYLPYVAFLYEGYKLRPLDKKDWQHYMDVQFQEGVNLDALEEAAATVKRSLKLPDDYKLKVFFSIFQPVEEQHEFGIINGKMRDMANPEDREAAIRWFVDSQYERFHAKKYKHLDLAGYYWFVEAIDSGDKELTGLIKSVTDHVRDLNLITTWIPWYLAPGYDNWRSFGFDMACLQPNYAFNKNIAESRLDDAAVTAKLFGMCIEIEVGGTQRWNIEHTKNYYAYGAKHRYMQDAAHMYYLGGIPGDFIHSYKADKPYDRSLYEDTYKFIKGTYSEKDIGESTYKDFQ